jgi:hypothetical protein
MAAVLVMTAAGGAFAAEKTDKKFSAAQLKAMSTFVSNFTEQNMFDFNEASISLDEIIEFAVRHNYINNYKSRIQRCRVKDCPYGALAIDPKWVAETAQKYFAYKVKHKSCEGASPVIHYDGKLYHFDGADGEATYYARVDRAEPDGSGRIVMTGEIYNVEDESDVFGTFTAEAKPHKFGGKDTWAILSMTTEQR